MMLPLNRTHVHYGVPAVAQGFCSYNRHYFKSDPDRLQTWAGLRTPAGKAQLRQMMLEAKALKLRFAFRIIRSNHLAFPGVPETQPSIEVIVDDRPFQIWAPETDADWENWKNDLIEIRDSMPYLPWLMDVSFFGGILDEENVPSEIIDHYGQDAYIELVKRDMDIQNEVWGGRVSVCMPGLAAVIGRPIMEHAHDIGIVAAHQDNFGDETIGKLYFDALTWLGATWSGPKTDEDVRVVSTPVLVQRAEVSGASIKRSWPERGIDQETMIGVDGEFDRAGFTLLGDMGNMDVPLQEGARDPNADARHAEYEARVGWVPPWEDTEPIPDPGEPPPGDGGDPDPVPAPFQFPVTVRGGEIVRAFYGGDIPDIVYDPGTTAAVIPIPIVNGKRWDPRVHMRSTTGSDAWTIDPAEPSGEDRVLSFHTRGRDRAVVTFEGYEEPVPDPDPDPDPVPEPPEYATRAELDQVNVKIDELIGRIARLEEHNDSWNQT